MSDKISRIFHFNITDRIVSLNHSDVSTHKTYITGSPAPFQEESKEQLFLVPCVQCTKLMVLYSHSMHCRGKKKHVLIRQTYFSQETWCTKYR